MIIKDDDVTARLNSPMNLINRIKNSKGKGNSAMGIFGLGRSNGVAPSAVSNNGTAKSSQAETEIKPTESGAGGEIKSYIENKWSFQKGTESSVEAGNSDSATNSSAEAIPGNSIARRDSANIEKNNNGIVKIEDLIDDVESKLGITNAHSNALKLMNNSITLLSTKLDEVKPSQLSRIIATASKVVTSIRQEKNEAAKTGKDREVHYHFYTPVQKKLDDYEVIEVEGVRLPEQNIHSNPSETER